jgi:hypothetical protein
VSNKDISPDDRYALYEHAHHDLWWAKAQQWNVANWALLLLAGEGAIARTLIPTNYLTLKATWPFLILNLVIPVAATWYLSKLLDIVHDRKVYRELESQTGVEALRGELQAKGLQAADKETDYKRGAEMLFVMAVFLPWLVGWRLPSSAVASATRC